MQRLLLFLACLLQVQAIFAQKSFSAFIDGSQPYNNYYDGFSYNVTLEISLVKKTPRTSTSAPGDEDRVYNVRLNSVIPAGGGYYHKGFKKIYTCQQLGSFCNPSDFREIQGKIRSDCDSRIGMDFNFTAVGQQKQFNVYIKDGCQGSDYDFEVREPFSVINNFNQYNERVYEIENPKPNTTSTAVTVAGAASQTSTTTKNNPVGNEPVLENRSTTYSNPMVTSTNSPSNDKFTTDMQNATTVVTGVAGLLAPDPENQRRREEENARQEEEKARKEEERARLEKADFEVRNQKAEAYFKSKYLDKYLQEAINGNESTRMFLILKASAIAKGYSQKLGQQQPQLVAMLPDHAQWLNDACANNNVDAMNWQAKFITYPTDNTVNNRAQALRHLEKAVSLGSVDAMVALGSYYDKKDIGNDAAKAYDYYAKAAAQGSPIAMYYLGMIYRYGKTTDAEYFTKPQVKHAVKKDDQKAFEWFSKSLAAQDYTETIHAKTIKAVMFPYIQPYQYLGISMFVHNTYDELGKMYLKGLGVQKDVIKAKEMFDAYRNYKYDIEYW